MTLIVIVRDEQTGDEETQRVAEGDYVIVCHDPCYLHGVQTHRNGTHVLTVKGRTVSGREVKEIRGH